MHEIIVDGTSLKNLFFVTSVNRTMGPPTKDRVIKVAGYIISDVLNTVDVLNKLLTGNLQEFIFTDQPDRYWLGKVKGGILPSKSDSWAKVSIDIEVPDGVSYSTTPKEIEVKSATSIKVTNDGSETVYPQFECALNGDTYMVSLASKTKAFQYGESLEASPLKEIKISTTRLTEGQMVRRTQELIMDKPSELNNWASYDANRLNGNWTQAGSFSVNNTSTKAPVNGRVTIGHQATHWQTGERMANWVKGQTFDVVGTKSVNQSHSRKAYLLKSGKWYMGWLLEQDIDGAGTSQVSTIAPNYGSGGAYGWHGPCISKTFTGSSTNWSVEMKHFFKIASPSEMGAVFISVLSGSEEIASVLFSSHQNNRYVFHQYSAKGEALQNNDVNNSFSSDSYGSISMLKNGDQITFEIRNDRTGDRIIKNYNVYGLSGMEADRVAIWCGQYGNFPKPSDNRIESVRFKGYDTQVWVAPKTEEVVNVINLPNPRNKWVKGDQIVMDMSDLSAKVNGSECLSPIAFGSQAIGIPPGSHEIAVVTNGDAQPDVIVRYREVFR